LNNKFNPIVIIKHSLEKGEKGQKDGLTLQQIAQFIDEWINRPIEDFKYELMRFKHQEHQDFSKFVKKALQHFIVQRLYKINEQRIRRGKWVRRAHSVRVVRSVKRLLKNRKRTQQRNREQIVNQIRSDALLYALTGYVVIRKQWVMQGKKVERQYTKNRIVDVVRIFVADRYGIYLEDLIKSGKTILKEYKIINKDDDSVQQEDNKIVVAGRLYKLERMFDFRDDKKFAQTQIKLDLDRDIFEHWDHELSELGLKMKRDKDWLKTLLSIAKYKGLISDDAGLLGSLEGESKIPPNSPYWEKAMGPIYHAAEQMINQAVDRRHNVVGNIEGWQRERAYNVDKIETEKFDKISFEEQHKKFTSAEERIEALKRKHQSLGDI